MYEALFNEYHGGLGHGRTVEEIVDWIEALPPMPDVVSRALRLIEDINSSAEELAGVIRLDPALASPLVRMANAASLGRQQEVSTLDDAILVVGLGQIKTMLMASALRHWNRKFGPLERLAWEKSIGVAAAAHVLAGRRLKRHRDELYLTGLLHNLGQMVMLSHKEVGAAYPAVIERMRETDVDFAAAEREVIGFSHPLVGAMVAQKWGFSVTTCQSILRCGDPLEKITGEKDEKLALLKMAASLALALNIGRPEGYLHDARPDLEHTALMLGFDPATLASEIDEAAGETKERFTAEIGAFV